VVVEPHRPRQLRPARLGLSRQARHRPGRPQAGNGPHLGQEPCQWRQESQGSPAARDYRSRRPERAADRRSAGALRLLWRERRRSLGKKDIVSVKALQIAGSNGVEEQFNTWDGSYFATARVAAQRAYREAGIDRPREQLSLVECHDCFSVTELVTLEDLFISPEGGAVRDVLDGFYDSDGKVPCQIDGGLKCFGHPIGASGIRMIYEMYLQLQGRAGARQRPDVRLGLTHNLGGFPARNVCSVAIVGAFGA
jgi:acetyl-CoA C-acetyltransferase